MRNNQRAAGGVIPLLHAAKASHAADLWCKHISGELQARHFLGGRQNPGPFFGGLHSTVAIARRVVVIIPVAILLCSDYYDIEESKVQ